MSNSVKVMVRNEYQTIDESSFYDYVDLDELDNVVKEFKRFSFNHDGQEFAVTSTQYVQTHDSLHYEIFLEEV